MGATHGVPASNATLTFDALVDRKKRLTTRPGPVIKVIQASAAPSAPRGFSRCMRTMTPRAQHSAPAGSAPPDPPSRHDDTNVAAEMAVSVTVLRASTGLLSAGLGGSIALGGSAGRVAAAVVAVAALAATLAVWQMLIQAAIPKRIRMACLILAVAVVVGAVCAELAAHDGPEPASARGHR